MAKIPRVDNFLFCYPLRSGILFISSLTIAIYVLQLLLLAFVYDSFMATMEFRRESSFSNDRIYGIYQGAAFSRGAGQTLGVGLGVIILHVLVIIGVLYKKPNLLIPWLAIAGFGLGLTPFALIGVTIFFAVFLPTMPAMTAGVFFLILILMGCNFHVFCVMYTYYKQLKEEPEWSNIVMGSISGKEMGSISGKEIPISKVV